MNPARGIPYGMYATKWIYDTYMLVQDIQTWPKGDVTSLRMGIIEEDISLLREWIVISWLNT
jgi:hypothetical protein